MKYFFSAHVYRVFAVVGIILVVVVGPSSMHAPHTAVDVVYASGTGMTSGGGGGGGSGDSGGGGGGGGDPLGSPTEVGDTTDAGPPQCACVPVGNDPNNPPENIPAVWDGTSWMGDSSGGSTGSSGYGGDPGPTCIPGVNCPPITDTTCTPGVDVGCPLPTSTPKPCVVAGLIQAPGIFAGIQRRALLGGWGGGSPVQVLQPQQTHSTQRQPCHPGGPGGYDLGGSLDLFDFTDGENLDIVVLDGIPTLKPTNPDTITFAIPPVSFTAFSAHPSLINPQSTANRVTTVSWDTQHAKTCKVTSNNSPDVWEGTTTQSRVSLPITAQTTFILTCVGDDAIVYSTSTLVNIVPTFQER